MVSQEIKCTNNALGFSFVEPSALKEISKVSQDRERIVIQVGNNTSKIPNDVCLHYN